MWPKEITNSQELSSDLHMCAMGPYTHDNNKIKTSNCLHLTYIWVKNALIVGVLEITNN